MRDRLERTLLGLLVGQGCRRSRFVMPSSFQQKEEAA